jgi:class 3 adenylate cyclase
MSLFGIKKRFHWQPDSFEFTQPFQTPAPFSFSFKRFPKGIDNTHIDTYLSPQFTGATQKLVRRMLLHEVGLNLWGEAPPPPGVGDLEEFEATYVGVMEMAISNARKSSRPDLLQLLQFAVLKFMLQVVGDELKLHRERLYRARIADEGHFSGRAVQLHERIVAFARDESTLRFRLNQKLFRQVYKLESTSLRKLRKSVLGRSWPVPREILFNPLLQLSSLWAGEELMQQYSLVVLDEDDPDGFDRMNRLFVSLFQDHLPSWIKPPSADISENTEEVGADTVLELRQRLDQGALRGFLETELLLHNTLSEQEYMEGRCSWLDAPENFDFFVEDAGVRKIRGVEQQVRVHPLSNSGNWRRYLADIVRILQQAGIGKKLLAAREAPDLYKKLHRQVPVRLICQYLEGNLSSRKLLRRISGEKKLTESADIIKLLDKAAVDLKRVPKPQQATYLLEFLKQFARLRRDLKLAYRSHWIMNHLRILAADEEVELSRSNGSLQEFLLHDEQGLEQHRIRNHVIIKADVRGSTAITAQLRDRDLNPATHFSLNFFQPITHLLDDYGATKVFVEGDAVILSIVEYEDTPYQWLSVCHACGLARKILQVVDAQNAKNRKHGLPELEIGLGISFSDEPPTFLYDGDHQIMISPAINRADQLSSCSSLLRRTGLGEDQNRGVEVVVPVDQGATRKESSDRLLRYNVNGIELDVPAFFKIKNELALRKVGGAMPGYSEQSVFYAARFPDRKGAMHWLVLREAPVRLWIGNSISTEEQWGRRFYEVITDPDTLAIAKERLRSKRGEKLDKPGGKPIAPDDEVDDKPPILH